MATVTLSFGGREHQVACRDGDEPRLQRLGMILNERWPQAMRAAGGVTGERAMLLMALMLADELDEARAGASQGTAPDEAELVRIAGLLEGLADALEQSATNA